MRTQPGALKTLTSSKLAAFVMGQQQKSRFQREKEERDERRRVADAEAALVYEEFVTDFDRDARSQPFVRAGGGARSPVHSRGTGGGSGRAVQVEKAPSAAVIPAGRKPRQIDSLLEELKSTQAARGAQGPAPGLYDDGYTATTNLFVSNLNPVVTEEALGRLFGRYGEILSCKVMWPRTDEERLRGHNNGFVSFVRREDAEDAMSALESYEFKGHRLTMGWGKAVRNHAPPSSVRPALGHTSPGWASHEVPAPRHASSVPNGADVFVQEPRDDAQLLLIDRLARFVATKDAQHFERAVAERERSNPLFSFLREHETPAATYYRWKVFSLLMGDAADEWREQPFQMFVNGGLWHPPRVPERMKRSRAHRLDRERSRDKRSRRGAKPSAGVGDFSHCRTGRQLELARARDKGRIVDAHLEEDESRRFMGMLQSLTTARAHVREAMAFSLDHAEASADIVEMLQESLVLAETPAAAKIARLYLVSDILHNSSTQVKNASSYRTLFQDVLPDIFESLNTTHLGMTGRMSANAMQSKVMGLLSVWQSWSLYPPVFLEGLCCTFRRPRPTREAPPPASDGSSREELERRCRLSGLSRSGTSDDMLRRLSHMNEHAAGAPQPQRRVSASPNTLPQVAETAAAAGINVSDDIDGEAMPEDNGIDGEAMPDSHSESESDPGFG
jgi:U2-associated protein SR140